MTTYTVSVVGAGWGGHLSMAGAAASDRFKLVAVADLDDAAQERAKATYPDIQIFGTHDEMFAQCPTDVVCIATWPPSHLPITRDALKLPLKGILVEKPLCDLYASGAEVLRLVREKQIPLAVPHGLMVAPHALTVIERVHAGEIGELKLVEIQNDGWDIINAGIHWLNFFVMVTKHEPIDHVLAAIDATTRTYRDGMQVETTAVTSAQTKSGVRVVMTTGDYVTVNAQGKDTLFRLIGTKGMIEFYGWESSYCIVNQAHPDGTLIAVDPGEATRHQLHLEKLATHMDNGTVDYADGESSLMALEMCEAAYLSGRFSCVVRFPLETFVPPTAVNWQPGYLYSGQGGGRNGRSLPPRETN
ncbi:MAG: Gfo/Idh/MocA family oxidoreductase [Chloroflexota bacterium]